MAPEQHSPAGSTDDAPQGASDARRFAKAHDKRDKAPCSQHSPETRKEPPSCFHMLYESRDSRLCLFESAEGHLMAVDASKLA